MGIRKRRVLYWCTAALMAAVVLSACSGLNIGAPTRLGDAPAPTTIPLQDPQTAASSQANPAPPLEPIALPAGFQISVYAAGLENPRMMEIGPGGQPYVAERGAGRIVRLPDRDGDGLADQSEVVVEGLSQPSSLAFGPGGALYVAETGRVLRYQPADEPGQFQGAEVVVDDLPTVGSHTTRTLLFSPDGATLYVSVGSSCDVCEEDDARRAAIVRYNPDGSGEQLFAVGLRNAVGITLRSGTDELWATNNGRDWLGDDLPPDTVHRVRAGDDHGWPRCHAARILDPQFGGPGACDDVVPPMVELQAHSAPLGLAFYDGDQFPPEYRGDLFVAFHGSWNRSDPTGFKVVRIPMDGDQPGAVEDFAVGWLRPDQSRWGRPVDLVVTPDGGMLVSDDGGGFIYRIVYLGG